ncbi:hypothetical protein [Chryseobacterium luteum]|uniref:Uncharacterized protein n=1 Tax=Chryseobacterium luteum TaxID=421531 RepID=A0A085ZBB0_9FLAO|nr:hypothetical protein [Chryseobacterium luteum]KFF01724.1 hypothetical protein IX38_16790 [Chryseobacterium luteum]
MNGNLKIGSRHVHLANGEPVQVTGSITIKRGRVCEIDNGSGYYEPTQKEAANFKKIFEESGIDMSKAKENYKYFKN